MEYLCQNKEGLSSFDNYRDACEYDFQSVYAYDRLSGRGYTHQELIELNAYLYDHIMPACAGLHDPDNTSLADEALDEYNASCFAGRPDGSLFKEAKIREAAVALRFGHLDWSYAALETYEKNKQEDMKGNQNKDNE